MHSQDAVDAVDAVRGNAIDVAARQAVHSVLTLTDLARTSWDISAYGAALMSAQVTYWEFLSQETRDAHEEWVRAVVGTSCGPVEGESLMTRFVQLLKPFLAEPGT
jgi:hypothetical protein